MQEEMMVGGEGVGIGGCGGGTTVKKFAADETDVNVVGEQSALALGGKVKVKGGWFDCWGVGATEAWEGRSCRGRGTEALWRG